MSLPHALLTSLIEKPCSGYELARRFDKSIGYFWHATHQQIYRELARMEENGWVSSSEVEGGRAGKKRFEVLPAGRTELQRWAAESAAPLRLRDELMLKLRAEAAIGPLGISEELEKRLHLHEQELANYRRIEERDFNAPSLSRENEIHYLILKAGIAYEEGRIQWTKEALAVIHRLHNNSQTSSR